MWIKPSTHHTFLHPIPVARLPFQRPIRSPGHPRFPTICSLKMKNHSIDDSRNSRHKYKNMYRAWIANVESNLINNFATYMSDILLLVDNCWQIYSLKCLATFHRSDLKLESADKGSFDQCYRLMRKHVDISCHEFSYMKHRALRVNPLKFSPVIWVIELRTREPTTTPIMYLQQ